VQRSGESFPKLNCMADELGSPHPIIGSSRGMKTDTRLHLIKFQMQVQSLYVLNLNVSAY
jgi:hypothetical protein